MLRTPLRNAYSEEYADPSGTFKCDFDSTFQPVCFPRLQLALISIDSQAKQLTN